MLSLSVLLRKMAAIVVSEDRRGEPESHESLLRATLLSKPHFQEAMVLPQNLQRVNSMNPRDSKALPSLRENGTVFACGPHISPGTFKSFLSH